MQLTTYIDKRLAAWVVWCRWGGRGAPQRVVSWYESIVMAPNVQGRGSNPQPCPVNEAEAMETNRAVSVLPQHLRDTIIEYWFYSGTIEMKAQRLRVGRQQFHYRLTLANSKILGYLNDLAAGIPLPAPEESHKNAKIRTGKKTLTLSDSLRTFPARLA